MTLVCLPAAAFQSDDFDRKNLDPGRWTLVNPQGDGWVRMVAAGTGDARLELSLPEGPSHDPYHENRALRVMQPIADADFTLEAKFESDPTQRYQLQGFIVEADADDWIRFDTFHDGTTQRIFAAVTIAGGSSARFNLPIGGGEARHLRLVRSGNLWTCSYSIDGVAWTTAGDFAHALGVTAAGVFAANHASGGASPAYTAVVDWVAEASDPIVGEDQTLEPDTLAPLIQAITTTPSVSELRIAWRTDEPALGTVDYGETQGYELGSLSDSGGTTLHELDLPGLVPGNTYHFRIRSSDDVPLEATTGNFEIFFDPLGPQFDLFHGAAQAFGQLGQPQPWVNVLGNVSDPDGVAGLTYTLNGGAPIPLSIGPDGRRLVEPGDFNIDLDVADLASGVNEVEITAVDGGGNPSLASVSVNYQPGTLWPLPYSVDWSALPDVDAIQDVAQVVDGRWILDAGQIRTADPGYDRLVAIGDRTWTDVEFTVPIVLHTTAGSHGVGVLLRWDGHTDTPVVCAQPKCGYLPLGGILWARPNRLEIYGNGGTIYASQSRTLTPGVPYWFKGRVETAPGGSLYRLKVWEDGQPEPGAWDVEGSGGPGDPQQGSLLLISHLADASFGNVSVTELAPPQNLPPIATDDAAFVPPGGSVEIVVLGNDADPDGVLDPTSVAIATSPSHGIATPDPVSGRIVYAHGGSATTTDTFTYTVDDATGATSNAATVNLTVTADPPEGASSDDFNRPALDESFWMLINPTGHGTVETTGAGSGEALLLLSLPAGIPHDAWGAGGVNESLRIMQQVPDVDFTLEAKWNSEPTGGYNDQGILVEQDADDWLRFDVFHTGDSLRLFVGRTANGVNTAMLNQSISVGSATHLRVVRAGDTFTTWTSGDGVAWTQQHVFVHALAVSRVGVYAANPLDGLAFTSEVDYFFEVGSALADEDANAVDITIAGMGSVSREPDLASHALGSDVLLTATPEPGWQFAGWTGDLEGAENATSLQITGRMRVTAVFVGLAVPGLTPVAVGLLVASLAWAGRRRGTR